jgi:hypothetical protein
MRPQIRSVGRPKSHGARIVYMLTSSLVLFLGFQVEGAATPVPRELYGKSVSISVNIHQTFLNETTGRFINLYGEQAATFYFSSLGRIFARFTNRNPSGSLTSEQVGSDPNKINHPTVATGNAQRPGSTPTTFQDIHFEGRTLVANQNVGENGTRRATVEFDQNFRSCTWTTDLRSHNGKPVRRIGWGGNVEVVSGETVSNLVCMIRDGNAFAQ